MVMRSRASLAGLLVIAGVTLAFPGVAPAHASPDRRSAAVLGQKRPAQIAISDFWKGLVFVSASGRRLAEPRRRRVGDFSIAPDGQRIAYDAGTYSIAVSRLSSKRGTRAVRGESPSWSPDGRQITYDNSNTSNGHEASIYTDRLGSRPVELVDTGKWDQTPVWSPDGVHIAFEQETPSGGIGRRSGIYVTDGTTQTVVQLDGGTRGVNSEPAWSPNGKQIAFISDRHGAKSEGGRLHDVYVVNADGSGLRRLTFDRRRDEDSPTWSPDGREIAYAVSTANDARTGVAVQRVAGGRACLAYTTWAGVDEVQWRPGYTGGPERPRHCSMSLRPHHPSKPRLGCSAGAARNAVNRSRLSLPLKQVANQPNGFGDFHFICPDFTRDGRADLVVTFSGGVTGNTFHWAALRRGARDWHLVASKRGAYMTLTEDNHDILEKQPVISDKHGIKFTGFNFSLYSWNGRRLVRIAHWHTRASSR